MIAREMFAIGDVVELSSEGQAWWRDQQQKPGKHRRLPPGADPKRGKVVGFSPRHPERMHVLRDGYKTAKLTKTKYWTKPPA